MTATTRASFARALARICFLLIFQGTGLYVPQLLAQSSQPQADALRKQVAALQAAALNSASQAVASAASGTSAASISDDAANLADVPAATARLQAAAAGVAAKKPGTRRIGLLLPANQMDGKGALSDGEIIRDAEAKLLTGPSLETVRLKAVLPEQALAEARMNDCDYVLGATVTQTQAEAPATTGRFSRFVNMRTVHMAATAAQFVPGIQGAALVTNMVLGSYMQTQMLTASKAVKANSDVRYEYTLTDIAGTVKLHDTEQLRSKSDGENVLTPMLTTAAQKIAPAVTN